jgi:hypothetical protein
MRRRQFIAGLGGAVAWPVAALAQQPERRVGFLHALAQNDPEARARVAALREGLAQLGWTECNIRIEQITTKCRNTRPNWWVRYLKLLSPTQHPPLRR